MIINKNALTAVFQNLKVTFNKAFEAEPTEWQKIAMKIPSSSGQNVYAWFGTFPKMRRWVGNKHKQALKALSYIVENDDFEVTVEVKRNDIEDDNLGIYAPVAQMAGASAKLLPSEIVSELVNSAFTKACYDGQYLCDTDHEVADASVSNKLTAALDFSSVLAAKASFGLARTTMRKFKDEEGRSLRTKPTILLVGPALEDTAKIGMSAERLEDGKPNPYRNSCEVVVDDDIESDTQWFLIDGSKPIKPFGYQERKAPVLVSQTNMDSDDVFDRGVYKYGAEARAAGLFGLWQLIVGSTGQG